MKCSAMLASLVIIIFASCSFIGGKRVNGNGNVISQDRNAGDFSRVDVGGAIDVYIKQAPSRSVRVETDENLQELVEVFERGGRLHISPRNNYNLNPSNNSIKVYVTAPEFRLLDVSGASSIQSEEKITSNETLDIGISGASKVKIITNAPRINAQLSGASNLSIGGETRDFDVRGSGASDISGFDLKAENTTVDLSGACSAEVFASVNLDVHASGASGVKYMGSAAVKQNTSGASHVKKID